MAAAFRRFDKCKIYIFLCQNLPVNLPLIVGDIHAADRVIRFRGMVYCNFFLIDQNTEYYEIQQQKQYCPYPYSFFHTLHHFAPAQICLFICFHFSPHSAVKTTFCVTAQPDKLSQGRSVFFLSTNYLLP
jgi:hypothetical protein